MYQIIRVLNNNSILAKTAAEGKEIILMGNGIGYKHRNDKEITEASDTYRTFIALEKNLSRDYLNLIDTVDEQILAACSEIILKARENLGELNPSLFVILSAHIDFAIKRIKEHMIIQHPLMQEIEILYPKEFAVATEGKNLLEKRLQLDISNDEIGYIALHLNAARYNNDVKDALKRTNLIKILVDQTEKLLHIKFVKNLAYRQLVDLLRGMMERLEYGIVVPNALASRIITTYPQEFFAAGKLAEILQQHYNRPLIQDEVAFMALNLYQIIEIAKRLDRQQ